MFRSGQRFWRIFGNSLKRTDVYLYKPFMSKTNDEWRAVLSPQQFRVLRERGTEQPYSGEYTDTPATPSGVYECVACSNPLYKSSTKFPSHCGWPAFYEAIPGSIKVYRDVSFGMVREEMRCSKCDGHLGHIFKGEGFDTPTDERHCVNSICLKYKP
ncbi:Piso0_005881 [Millerozyma farinosa CBS 7064]|uniref:Peptide-methionine (R)-S-oxide reductase n=1 Tax=Pichia sorbitophila (strain ATCC MYA-4447 / BCRC 22081 / CBS 7064 / NBRC 10061 / NRRL Y-12695) TaxID=559304 RepID=G8Y074_PICSO|nr:Piso0_005881 [Millerozyma farinosa CBS 7064]